MPTRVGQSLLDDSVDGQADPCRQVQGFRHLETDRQTRILGFGHQLRQILLTGLRDMRNLVLPSQDGQHAAHVTQGLAPGVTDAAHGHRRAVGIRSGRRCRAVGDDYHDPQTVGDDVVDLASDS